MPDIHVSGLTKIFGDTQVLNEIDFEVLDKEFLTLLGPSGCGKTTTLMSIAGFQRPDGGRIRCGDDLFYDRDAKVDLAAEDRNLGMVFQSYAIWPHLTVFDNVAFPLRIRRVRKAALRARVRETLDLVEMGRYADRYPHEISGGQQQRVALARALVYSPSVLLLDEPFSNLDAKLRERARTWLKQLQGEIGITTLFVTHDQDEALSLSDRIVVMDSGAILQVGSPEEIYRRPTSRFVAEFLGQCNLLDAVAVDTTTGGTRYRLEDGSLLVAAGAPTAPGKNVSIAVRPEAVEVVAADSGGTNTFAAEVVTSSFLGDHYVHQLRIDTMALTVDDRAAADGPQLAVRIPPDACQILPASDRAPGGDVQ